MALLKQRNKTGNQKMVKLSKGQTFYYCTQYNGKGAILIRKLTCTACGKKIIRAIKESSGETIKFAIQQNLVNIPDSDKMQSFNFDHIFSADSDIELEAKKMSARYIKRGKEALEALRLKGVIKKDVDFGFEIVLD